MVKTGGTNENQMHEVGLKKTELFRAEFRIQNKAIVCQSNIFKNDKPSSLDYTRKLLIAAVMILSCTINEKSGNEREDK